MSTKNSYAVCFCKPTNPEAFARDYMTGVGATVDKFGGKHLMVGETKNYKHCEDEAKDFPYAVVIEFPGEDGAKKWHDSAEYLKILPAALENANMPMVVTTGTGASSEGGCYLVAFVKIKNPEPFMKNYVSVVADTATPYGGRPIVKIPIPKAQATTEPMNAYDLCAVYAFPSWEKAEAWYKSSEYQAILPHRVNNTSIACVIAEALENQSAEKLAAKYKKEMLARTAANAEVKAAGFPPLGVFDHFSPDLLSLFVKKEVLLRTELSHIDSQEKEAIDTAISAGNSCEMCLSFHALGLSKHASAEDVQEILQGGLPKATKLRNAVIAAKIINSHKGALLDREKKHLASLGYHGAKLLQAIFYVGQIAANNRLFVYLMNEGAPVEDFLRAAGPFSKTVYAKKE